MKIVGLVSSFREGATLRSAVESLRALDYCIVFEGPVEGNPPAGPESELPPLDRSGWLSCRAGEWETDAAKRTALLEQAKRLPRQQGEPLWGVWLDGDELLLWGQYLRDWLSAAIEEAETEENPVAGWPLSLVELDGS